MLKKVLQIQFVVCAIFLTLHQIQATVSITDDIADEFVKKSLEIQYDLAEQVKSVISKPVYVFDASEAFKNADIVVVGKIRVLKSQEGNYGVLSESAQLTFTNINDYLQFSNKNFNSDSIGLYI